MHQNPKREPSRVVDYSKGEYIFGFEGVTIRKSILVRIDLMKQAITAARTELADILPVRDAASLVDLFVALQSDDLDVHGMYAVALAKRIVELEKRINELSRIGKGMTDKLNYLLSVKEMELFGL